MIWAYIALIVVSLFLSAFISGSETAYLSTNRFRLRNLASKNNRAARRVLRIVSKPDDLFSAILLINNLVNILIATLTGALVGELFNTSPAVTVLLSTIATTTAVVVLSEITPKSIAAAIPERWSLATSRIISFLVLYTKPLTFGVVFIPRTLLKLLGTNVASANSPITPADLRMLIDIGEEDGTVGDVQGEMLDNIFRFGEKNVASVMTPRPEIEWISNDDTVGTFLKHYVNSNHTRFPVIDQAKDDVIGILSAKRVLSYIAKNGNKQGTKITKLMTQPMFIAETRTLLDLFKVMKTSGQRLALVVDEYGDVSGLVTITRLVEQVVGATGEEGEQPKQDFQRVKDGVYVVNAGMAVEDARDQLTLEIPTGNYDTVGGWFLYLAQRIPEQSDQMDVGDINLQVARMDGNRIVSLIISKKEQTKVLDG